MPRFRFLDEDVTTNEMPKEASAPKQKGKPRFRFVDEETSPLVENTRELVEQGAKGTLTGGLGSLGSILQFLGLQHEQKTPEERQTIAESESRELPPELALTSAISRGSRFPTIEEAEQKVESLGGVGKPKTFGGRFGKRMGQNIGGTLTFGGGGTAAAAGAGAVGQGLEELGAPPWAQAAGELMSYIWGSKAKTPIKSNSPAVNDVTKKLEKLGYSEQDITLAKNALEERNWLKKTSKWNAASEKKFKESLKNSESNVDAILESSFPGMATEGTDPLRRASEGLFENLDDLAKNVVIENPDSFVKNGNKAVERLKNTLANTPQEKEVIGILESAINAAVPGRTGDVYTRFYKGLNQIGRWGSPKEREHVFSIVKDAIKQTFREQGTQGKQLAKALEDANESWVKYLRAEDVSELLKKSVTEEGMNFKKLSKSLENSNNYQTLEKGLGKSQAKNVRLIADTASSIGDLEKAMRGGPLKDAIGLGKAYALVKGLATFDLGVLKSYAISETVGRASTKLLTDPKYQNMTLRLLNAIKDKKYDLVRTLAQEMEKEPEPVKTGR